VPALENVLEYGAPVASRPGSPFRHVTSCDELTLNETDWPTEILVFDGENEKPLFETVAAGPEGALVVVVAESTMREIVFDDDLAG